MKIPSTSDRTLYSHATRRMSQRRKRRRLWTSMNNFSIRLSSLYVVAWRAENLFLHRIHAGHNWMYVCTYVYFYVENGKEEDLRSECSGSNKKTLKKWHKVKRCESTNYCIIINSFSITYHNMKYYCLCVCEKWKIHFHTPNLLLFFTSLSHSSPPTFLLKWLFFTIFGSSFVDTNFCAICSVFFFSSFKIFCGDTTEGWRKSDE